MYQNLLKKCSYWRSTCSHVATLKIDANHVSIFFFFVCSKSKHYLNQMMFLATCFQTDFLWVLTLVFNITTRTQTSRWRDIRPRTWVSVEAENAIYSTLQICVLWCNQETHFRSRPFLLSFLTCCAILPTSYGGKGSYLRRWLVKQPSLRFLSWSFPKFSSAVR